MQNKTKKTKENHGMGSKKYKINKQTTYLLLYYQENKYGTQTKQKKMRKKLLLHEKQEKNHTHTNKKKNTFTKTPNAIFSLSPH